MFTPPTHMLIARDDAASNGGLSRQNIIIIAACAGGGGLLFVFFFYRSLRSCLRSGDPAPLPPVQPLAHHREQQVARMDETLASRPQTWYSTTPPPPPRSIGSNTSLLGRNSPVLSPSSSSASPTPYNSQLIDLPSPNHLSLPSPSYHADSSSLHSSEASCSPLPSENSSALALPRPIVDLRSSHTPNRRTRPLSTSSVGSFNSRTSRNTIRGAPHSPYSGVQIILPTPLASATNSRDSLSPNDPRFSSYGRRSVADPWLSVELSGHDAESLEDPQPTSRRRRRPASLSSLRSEITAHSQPIPPPVPQLPSDLEKSSRGVADPRWAPSNGTLQESEKETDPRKR